MVGLKRHVLDSPATSYAVSVSKGAIKSDSCLNSELEIKIKAIRSEEKNPHHRETSLKDFFSLL